MKKSKPLSHAKIKTYVDRDYDFGYDTRLKASNDRVFGLVTQIDDVWDNTQLGYQGEFNVVKKGIRNTLTELAENPVQVDFVPEDPKRKDAGELVDGMYRTDDLENSSIESFENAKLDQVICGFGAWELYAEYSDLRSADDKQVIRRRPLYEACNTILWDGNAKMLDKSDAGRVTSLVSYSVDGYREYVAELTDVEPEDVQPVTFREPEQSYSFPWWGFGQSEKLYIGNFYHRQKTQDKILTMIDPIGMEREVLESQLKDVMDDLLNEGWKKESEKEITIWEVRKYIVDGREILNGDMGPDEERIGEVVSGEYLPIISCYGEHTIVEGEEHYEGVVRKAKDPARLHDMAMSYVADILSRSPRAKDIYTPEQLAGFAHMYAETGMDDNYAYRLQNLKTPAGVDLPLGPVGRTSEPTMPPALMPAIELTRGAIEDVAPAGLPDEISNPDTQIAFKTVQAMQQRIDGQSFLYQQHYQHAKRWDGVVYASIASQISDTPRTVTLTLPDGTEKEVEMMQTVTDEKTGKEIVINDINNLQFRVKAKIGPAYSSQKEQTIENMQRLKDGMQPGSTERRILELEIMTMMDGAGTDASRDYARKELITMGVKEPETDEEKKMLADAQAQPQKPDAGTLLAEAEMEKAKVGHEKNQIEILKAQLNKQNEDAKRMNDKYGEITDRLAVQINAQKAKAELDFKRADALNQNVDMAIADMDDDSVLQIAMGG